MYQLLLGTEIFGWITRELLTKKGKEEGLSIKSIVYREEVMKSEWARFEPGSCRILTIRDIIWQPKSFDIFVPKYLEAYTPCNDTDEQTCDS